MEHRPFLFARLCKANVDFSQRGVGAYKGEEPRTKRQQRRGRGAADDKGQGLRALLSPGDPRGDPSGSLSEACQHPEQTQTLWNALL